MAHTPPNVVIGCLLDVSGSMRKALKAGPQDGNLTKRLQAVLRASLQIARAEQTRNPEALMFVGAFGLKRNAGCPSVVDLCGVIDALLGLQGKGSRSGHDLLIELAHQHGRKYISKYIREKLTDDQARILHQHLQQNQEKISEFVNAIPSDEENRHAREQACTLGGVGAFLGAAAIVAVTGGAGIFIVGAAAAGGAAGVAGANKGADMYEDSKVDDSKAMKLAGDVWNGWWNSFRAFRARPVAEVIDLLERLQDHADTTAIKNNGEGQSSTNQVPKHRRTDEKDKRFNVLGKLKEYIYGRRTPMNKALRKAKDVFDLFYHEDAVKHRVLVVLSDGHWTDKDPQEIAQSLTQPESASSKVYLAVVHLTGNKDVPRRRLYDCEDPSWDKGQRALMKMASRVSALEHPIPVFASMGWKTPISGEVALYATVYTTAALDEFCTMLLSARFGSADALLDIVGRTRLDDYVNNEHEERRMYPSDQGYSETCYAHAAAAVIHMALSRVVIPQGQIHPTVETIRGKILEKFPAKKGGQNPKKVLDWITKEIQYSPIRHFREVDEEGARQAVLRRRPVLATFGLSKSGWDAFKDHFENKTTATSVLTFDEMEAYCSDPFAGGHAVVLIGCGPGSLKLLNSWSSKWGDDGAFSIENERVLSIKSRPMRFYDVFWKESDLTEAHRQAYCDYIDEKARALAADRPGYLTFEALCPLCEKHIPVLEFTGSIRRAICPRCTGSFAPEPEHLIQALYVKAGLGKDNPNDQC